MNRAERRRRQKISRKASKTTRFVQSADPSPNQHALNLQHSLDLAMQRHADGQLAEAENIFQQILKTAPDHPVALHRLGVINHQKGKNDIAVDFIMKAIATKPDYAEAHSHLGIIVSELGQLEEAVVHFYKAIAINPDAMTHYNLGNVLQDMEKKEDAVDSYREALIIKPDYFEAHCNLGNLLQQLEQPDEAVVHLNKALDINPNYAEVLIGLGNVHQDRGKLEDAVVSYQKALGINPNYAEAHGSLGTVLQELGRLEEAEKSYRTALKLKPDIIATVINLGNLLVDRAFNQSRTDGPRFCSSKSNNNLGTDSNNGGPWEEVIYCADRALSFIPYSSDALALKTVGLLGLNRYDDWAVLMGFDQLIQSRTMSVPKDYTDLKAFNEALLQRCANDPDKDPEPIKKSMTDGYRINSLQNDPPSSPVSFLLEFVNNAARQYRTEHPVDTKHPFLAQSPQIWNVKAWGTILGNQGYHKSHIHPSGWLSGVYYAKLPHVMETQNEKREGWIELGRPKNYVDNENSPEFHLIQPREGMVILFPSYFYHQTIPFESNDTRFTVAFDLIPSTW